MGNINRRIHGWGGRNFGSGLCQLKVNLSISGNLGEENLVLPLCLDSLECVLRFLHTLDNEKVCRTKLLLV